jgi:UDP-3-O-[3-hydroxymyristoyl] glucosamine N-acyltransferase
MPNEKFFRRAGPFTLKQIAELVGTNKVDQSELLIHDVATTSSAGPGHITFFNNHKYAESLHNSRAGACLVAEHDLDVLPAGIVPVLVKNAYLAYAQVVQMFYPNEPVMCGSISPRAVVQDGAVIEKNVVIGDFAFIGEGAQIGAGSVIGVGAYVGPHVSVGEGAVVHSYVTLMCAIIGRRCIIHSGARIGQDGFGFVPGTAGIVKIKQLGIVRIGDDVEIGAGTCIDRGAIEDTVIGNGCKIDNLVQIGHNCQIADNTIICGQVGLAGSTKVGSGVMLGGQVGIAGHVSIGDGAMVAAQSGVWSDVPSKQVVGGTPAQPIRDWHKATAMIKALVRKRKKGTV